MFERLVEIWAAGPRGGRCGSGWVVGDRGVLTCRHVLDDLLHGGDPEEVTAERVLQVRQARATAADQWVDTTVAWTAPDCDVALLEVTPSTDQLWPHQPLGRSPRLVALGGQIFGATACGFPGAQDRPDHQRGVEQHPGTVRPAVALRDEAGLVPFDVDDRAAIPDHSDLWQGVSGSAVFTEHGEIAGLVVKVHPQRQQRRLLFLPSERFATGEDFRDHARRLGLDPTLQDPEAHAWRNSLAPECLTPVGTPMRVEEVENLEVFGVHRAAKGADTADGPGQMRYLARDVDETELPTALDEAAGTGGRMVLVVGDSAAGKTRTTAEAVRRQPLLRGRRLLRPQVQGGLAALLTAQLPLEGVLIWLDDLDKYLAEGALEPLQRIRAEHPDATCVATIRSSQLAAHQEQLADPAYQYLTDSDRVQQLRLDAELSAAETIRLAAETSDAALLDAVADGVGLGEWLVAGPELMKRLDAATAVQKAVAHTVIGWDRTGLQRPLPAERLHDLWTVLLPAREKERLQRRRPADRAQVLERAVSWLCEPILDRDLYEQALAFHTAEGLQAHDYVVDRITNDPIRPRVPDALWEAALRAADSETHPGRLNALDVLAFSAISERAEPHALTAWGAIGSTPQHDLDGAGLDAEVAVARALINKGVVLGRLGHPEDEVATYDELLTRYTDDPTPALRERCAKALVNTALTLGELGRPDEAVVTYDELLTRYTDDPTPALREQCAIALVNKGVTLGELGHPEDEVATYDQLLTRYTDDPTPALREQAAMALLNKGITLGELGHPEDEVATYDQLLTRYTDDPTPALREQCAMALLNKALTLGRLGRPADEVATYDQLLTRYTDDPTPTLREQCAKALLNKGITLGRLDHPDEAVATYDHLLTRYTDDPTPTLREQCAKALLNKGITLGRLDHPDEAVATYDQLLTRYTDDPTPTLREQSAGALLNKGITLGRLDHPEDALATYDHLLTRYTDDPTPALRERCAKALVNKGVTLGELGRPEDEVVTYDELLARYADDSTPTLREQAAMALLSKGVTLGELDHPEDALATYDQLLTRYTDDPTPALRERCAGALLNKALTLGLLDRPENEVATYDELLTRYTDDPTPALREHAAMALLSKGVTLGLLDRPADEVATYDELLTRYVDDPTPALREQAAMALLSKGVTLGELGRLEDALEAHDELLTRYADDPTPALREQAAMALLNKGITLGELDRPEDALATYDELLTRYTHDPSDVVQEVVAHAAERKAQPHEANESGGTGRAARHG